MRAGIAFAVVLLAAGLVSAGCTASGSSGTGDANFPAKRTSAPDGKPSAAVKPATAEPHQWVPDTVLPALFSSTTQGRLQSLGFTQDPDWLTADGDAMKVTQTTVKNALPSDELGKTTNPKSCVSILTYGLNPATDAESDDPFITSVKYKQESAQIGGGDIEYRARTFADATAAARFMTEQAALRKTCASFTATLPDGTSGTINTTVKNLNGDKSFNDHTVMPGVTYSLTEGTYSNESYWVRDGNLILVVGTSGDAEAAGASTTAIQSILTNAVRNGPGETTTMGSFGPIGQTEGCAWLTKADLAPYVGSTPVPYVTSGHSALIDDCEWDTRPNDVHATEYEPHTVIYQVQYFSSLDDAKTTFASRAAPESDETPFTLGVGDESSAVTTMGTGEVTVSQVRFGHYISLVETIGALQDGATACKDLQQKIGERLK